MVDSVIIGGGIIGRTIFEAMKAEGRKCLLIDNKNPMAGSLASGGHFKPSWAASMKPQEYEDSAELLDNLFGIKTEKFKMRPTGVRVSVSRIDMDQVNGMDGHTYGTVTGITSGARPTVSYTLLEGNLKREIRCRTVVVAAGVWCDRLLDLDRPISVKQGVSFRFRGTVKTPFIKPWAPYKQIVAHQQNRREIWVGDGSAILEKNWTRTRTKECEDRCQHALKFKNGAIKTILGFRPYCNTDKAPCLCKHVQKNVWVATGAGKLGTIAAGWAAKLIMDKTND